MKIIYPSNTIREKYDEIAEFCKKTETTCFPHRKRQDRFSGYGHRYIQKFKKRIKTKRGAFRGREIKTS